MLLPEPQESRNTTLNHGHMYEFDVSSGRMAVALAYITIVRWPMPVSILVCQL